MTKRIITGIVLLLLLINIIDRPANQAAKEIFGNPEIKDEAQNGDLYLKGLFAPEGIAPEEYAKTLIAIQKGPDSSLDNQFEATDQYAEQHSLKLNSDDTDLTCWYSKKDCKNTKALSNLLSNNKTLLSRLNTLHTFTHFDQNTAAVLYPSGFTKLHDVFYAFLSLMKDNQDSEKALNLLLKNIQLQQKILNGREGMVLKAAAVYNLRRALPALLHLTKNNPELIKKHQEHLYQILSVEAFSNRGFNIKKTAQAEYNEYIRIFQHNLDKQLSTDTPFLTKIKYGFVKIFTFKPQATQNFLASWAHELILATENPSEKTLKDLKHIERQFGAGNVTITYFIYNPTGKLLATGSPLGTPIITQHFLYTTPQYKMVQLCLNARLNEISSSDMQSYIEKTDTNLYNPITQKPFQWDNDTQELYFNNPNDDDNTIRITCN